MGAVVGDCVDGGTEGMFVVGVSSEVVCDGATLANRSSAVRNMFTVFPEVS